MVYFAPGTIWSADNPNRIRRYTMKPTMYYLTLSLGLLAAAVTSVLAHLRSFNSWHR